MRICLDSVLTCSNDRAAQTWSLPVPSLRPQQEMEMHTQPSRLRDDHWKAAVPLEVRALVEPSVAPNSLAVPIFVTDVTIATAVCCLRLRHPQPKHAHQHPSWSLGSICKASQTKSRELIFRTQSPRVHPATCPEQISGFASVVATTVPIDV